MQERDLIIFDVDGVLADSSDRTPLAAEGLIDEFYELVEMDKPIEAGVRMAQFYEHMGAGTYEIIYLTGRPERCRKGTLAWLQKHVAPYITDDDLLMRESYDVDYRGFKTGVVEPFKDRVLMVVDDDDSVCKEMDALGITALHFRQPGLDFTSFWNNRNGRAEVVATGVKDDDCGCAEKRRKKEVVGR